MSITEQQLQQFVGAVFDKFDNDKSGQLDTKELANFFNEMYMSMKLPNRLNQQEAMQAMKAIDKNNDGKANKQ